MKRDFDARGMSIVELMVGLLIGSIVIVGAATVMTDIVSLSTRYQAQDLLNRTYLQGLQVAHNSYLFTEANPKAAELGLTPDLKKCLSYNPQYQTSLASTVDCRTFDNTTVYPQGKPFSAAFDASLNQGYSTSGPCQSANDPRCLVQRTTTHNWVCPHKEYCTGLRITVAATPIAPKAGSRSTASLGEAYRLRERKSLVFVPGRQIVSKGEISFTCGTGSAPNYAIFGLDYVKLSDRAGCSHFKPGPTCASPMIFYGGVSVNQNCSVTQNTTCKPNGFTQTGLFDVQQNCMTTLNAGGVPGVCGPATTATAASAPTSGLCATGAASAVSGTGPWSWTCAGSGGGADITCSTQGTGSGHWILAGYSGPETIPHAVYSSVNGGPFTLFGTGSGGSFPGDTQIQPSDSGCPVQNSIDTKKQFFPAAMTLPYWASFGATPIGARIIGIVRNGLGNPTGECSTLNQTCSYQQCSDSGCGAGAQTATYKCVAP